MPGGEGVARRLSGQHWERIPWVWWKEEVLPSPREKEPAGTTQRPFVHCAEWRYSRTRSEQSGILQGFEFQLSAQGAQETVQQGKLAPQAILWGRPKQWVLRHLVWAGETGVSPFLSPWPTSWGFRGWTVSLSGGRPITPNLASLCLVTASLWEWDWHWWDQTAPPLDQHSHQSQAPTDNAPLVFYLS